MRVTRLMVLALIALAAPFSRGAAQTCLGTAAFQDGRWRAGVDDQHNSDFNDVRGTVAYGVPRSLFGGVSVDEQQVAHGGSSLSGVAGQLGYQIHVSDAPFQICPEVWGRYVSGSGTDLSQVGFGASLGYRVGISDWFSLVPAAGIWSVRTSTAYKVNLVQPASGSSPNYLAEVNGTESQVLMTLGFVFNSMFTINPGVLVPSQAGAKAIYTIGVSINWAK